ncbi:MAG: sigma 54-interacting transcriptional regulator [Deltaproteobacteria bacterium]|nr:sigma 54-interacting transcriptional regulator [Deltaproteobacteria bacterium]
MLHENNVFPTAPPVLEKAFYPALLEGIRDAVIAVHSSGIITYSNPAATTHFNLSVGTQFEKAFPELKQQLLRTLKDRQNCLNQNIHIGEHHFLVNLYGIHEPGKSAGVLCILENRTEMNQIIHKMLSFQELSIELDTIIDSSYDGLWICDANATVLRINSASERLNNIRAAEVVGRNMTDLVAEGFINQSATLEVIKTKSTATMLQKTSTGRKLMITGSPIFDETGKLVHVVVNERDITEIDSLHEELQHQEAIKNQYRSHMLEMQLAEMESRRIIARSPCMASLLQQAIKVSKVDSTALILGESGAGKELIADLIHKHSNRASQPMIKINCGAIPESLVESELFGYEKGAFTGAQKQGKPGYVELAQDGLLFLDEIAELPLASQVKLLRFLEDGVVCRVGGVKNQKLNVRILAATNRNLKEMVSTGKFRKDLYYRLHVIPLHVPPLRERKECILPLLHHFLHFFAAKIGKSESIHLSKPVTEALLSYPYPGNVRELINICERAVVMSEGEWISLDDLPRDVAEARKSKELSDLMDLSQSSLKDLMGKFERSVLKKASTQYGTQDKIAKALGIDQATVARKLKKYGIVLQSQRGNTAP